MNHSPKLWKVVDIAHKAHLEIRSEHRWWPVARVKKMEGRGPEGITAEEALENAKLIADAPVMRDLLERAMKNARPQLGLTARRWVVVKHMFAVGSQRAQALCREFGYDPDEELIGPPLPSKES